VPRKRAARQPETEVVGGVLPSSLNAVPYIVPLPKAPIPNGLAATLSTGASAAITSTVRRVYLPEVLDSNTYARHFKHLLWIEEFRME
jgi:helicase MOV-10